MRIKDVITRVMAGKLNWMQAAEILGMSDRQLRRWRGHWEKYGYDGLFDRRMRRPSPKRVPVAEVEKVLRLYREQYFDLNVKHFVEKLHEEHGIGLSYSWVKTALQTTGLVRRYAKRGVHRQRRPRRPLPGMLLHIDGSSHHWIPGLNRQLDMIAVLDDATSEAYYARLVDEESTATIMAALKQVIEQRGVFCALYSDRASHFVYTPKAGEGPDRRVRTQVGRALEQMGIELIPANSPEARGRSERMFGTWQGRLPQEFRLRGIGSVEAANAFLSEWITAEHNRRFTIKARQEGTAFVPYFGSELDKIWSHQQERIVDNDNTVSYDKLTLQVAPQKFRFSLARCRVLVCRHLDESISLHYGPHLLGRYHANGHLRLDHAETYKTRDTLPRPGRRSAFIDDPGATFFANQGKERKKNQKRKKAAA